MQVGGIEEHVRKRGVVQRPIAKRGDLLVQPGADPRHLRLRDAGPDPERGDEVVDCPGRHPVHPRLHHHRIQGLVDPPSAFQNLLDREERALPQLRDPQLHIPGLRRHQPRAGPVPFGDTARIAFIAASAHDLAGLGFDQLLHDQPDRFADQVHALPGTERLQQFGCDRLRQRHRWEPPDEYLPVHIENLSDGPSTLATHRTPKPHHSLGLTPNVAGRADCNLSVMPSWDHPSYRSRRLADQLGCFPRAHEGGQRIRGRRGSNAQNLWMALNQSVTLHSWRARGRMSDAGPMPGVARAGR